jgi:hypothetical protein
MGLWCLYCGSFFVIAIAFILLFTAIAHKRRLVRPDVSDSALTRVWKAYLPGVVVVLDSLGLPIRTPVTLFKLRRSPVRNLIGVWQ